MRQKLTCPRVYHLLSSKGVHRDHIVLEFGDVWSADEGECLEIIAYATHAITFFSDTWQSKDRAVLLRDAHSTLVEDHGDAVGTVTSLQDRRDLGRSSVPSDLFVLAIGYH